MRPLLLRLLAATLLTAVVAGVAPAARAAEPTDRAIAGHLTQAGAPVVGARVDVFSGPTTVRAGTTTDADGAYEVVLEDPDTYRVRYTLADGRVQWAYQQPDYYTAEVFDLSAVGTVTVDEEVIPPPPSGALTVVAVDSATGGPIASFCAEAAASRGYSGCTTDGSVELTDVVVGTYEVYAYASGYLGRPGSTTVDVTADATATATITLDPAAPVTTVVRDARTRAPVANACVLGTPVGSPGINPPDRGACSGPDGVVRIDYLRPGTYVFYARVLDGQYGAQWVGRNGGTGSIDTARRVTAVAGRTVTLPPILLDRAGMIAGTVTSRATGAPVADVCAYPLAWDPSQGPNNGEPYCTDANGRYRIDGLGPYAWPVEFTTGNRPYAWQWSGGAPNREAAETVRVRVGRTATADARLLPEARITGTLTGAYAAYAFDAVTGDFAAPYAPTEESGAYALRGLGPQQVKVRASGNGGVRWYRDAPDFRRATPVAVPRGGTVTGIDVTVPAA